MQKIFLIDADGVVLKKHEYFSTRLARELELPAEDVTRFFTGDFVRCVMGQADLKEVIAPYVIKWGWLKSVDDLIEFWFESENIVEHEVVRAIADARTRGHFCYMVSDQEKYRAEFIRASIGHAFDGCYFSCDIGLKKSDPAYFTYVLTDLAAEKEQVKYMDDDPKNVAVATEFGLESRVFAGLEDLDFLQD